MCCSTLVLHQLSKNASHGFSKGKIRHLSTFMRETTDNPYCSLCIQTIDESKCFIMYQERHTKYKMQYPGYDIGLPITRKKITIFIQHRSDNLQGYLGKSPRGLGFFLG